MKLKAEGKGYKPQKYKRKVGSRKSSRVHVQPLTATKGACSLGYSSQPSPFQWAPSQLLPQRLSNHLNDRYLQCLQLFVGVIPAEGGPTVGKARREKKKEKTARKNAVRVVVLPIFWEQREAEAVEVKEAARKVEAMLAEELGVRVVVDDNNNFKPGERMKHW